MTTLAPPATGTDRRAADSLGARLRSRLGLTDRASAWVLPATLGVLALAAVLYTWNLTVSGFANEYYSAAAWAGSQSWSAWFFGSIDPSNFITVDKPPLATMVMGLSVRLFGLSSAAILLPEALMGIATVGILIATVRRTFGPAASIIAGVVAALAPAAVLMFRYNNPDALLTLLLVGGAYALLRAVEDGRHRWVILAAVLAGLAFETKLLQGWLVLPAFAVTYAVCAPGSVRRRLVGLALAAVSVVVASGWWVAAVELVPASVRPYIGGSTNGSPLDLILGYDGLGRIFGGQGNAAGGGGNFSGTPGLLRLFNDQMGGQIAWFLPFSVAGLAAGLVARARAGRTDPARAAFLMWGLWLAVHAIVFSFMSGTIHSYYTVAMAPAIGALVGGGAVTLWRARERREWVGAAMGVTVLVSAALAWTILDRTPSFVTGLGIGVFAAGVVLAAVLTLPTAVMPSRARVLAVVLAFGVLLAGPAAYASDTMATAYSGGVVSAGPSSGRDGFGGPSGGGFASGGPGGGQPPTGLLGGVGTPPSGLPSGGSSGGTPPSSGTSSSGATPPSSASGSSSGLSFWNRGGMGGSLDPSTIEYLVANRGSAKWIVAVQSANTAASIELASGQPVMAMAGFTGSDPAPTLDQLKADVATGQLRFVLVGGGGPGGGATSGISTWVSSACTVVGSSSSLYDCAGATS